MSRIVTFGELMLRLSPENGTRLFQNDRLTATFGGAEANVAVCLANFGEEVAFVTKLPDNPIGNAALSAVRAFGVNTAFIARGGERLGVYFMEKGASRRPSVCVYDRAGSAIAEATAADFDWDTIFDGADWFHFTGITAALSDTTAALCKAACKAAKERGLTVSCDLNYRKKLWSKEKARAVMTDLCAYVDVCVANEEDASDVFGITAAASTIEDGKLSKEGYRAVAKELRDRFGFSKVAITLRSSFSADDNDWAALLYDGENFCFSKTYSLHIVDRVGGGDSFGAGLIFALRRGDDTQNAVEFAVAASALKHSIEGDFNRVSVREVEALQNGGGSGRIQR